LRDCKNDWNDVIETRSLFELWRRTVQGQRRLAMGFCPEKGRMAGAVESTSILAFRLEAG